MRRPSMHYHCAWKTTTDQKSMTGTRRTIANRNFRNFHDSRELSHEKPKILTKIYVWAHRLEFSIYRLALNTDLTLLNTDAEPIMSICIEKLNNVRQFRDIGLMTPACPSPAFSSMNVLGPLVLNHRSVMNRTRDKQSLSPNELVQLEL